MLPPHSQNKGAGRKCNAEMYNTNVNTVLRHSMSSQITLIAPGSERGVKIGTVRK